MHKAKEKEMVNISRNQLDKRHKELAVYEKQLDSIRNEFGIISYDNQVSEITRGYMNALATGRGSSSDTKKIEKLYGNFSSQGAQSARLEHNFNQTISIIDSLNVLYGKHLAEYEKNITYSHIVEYPFPADKKSHPVRWLIVAFSTLSAIFLSGIKSNTSTY